MAPLFREAIAGLSLLLACSAFAQVAEAPAPEKLRDWRVPAMEIIGFDFLVNRVNHCCGTDRQDYAVSVGSIRRNLRGSWDVDADPFNVNQLGHPYQGSMYYGFARSSGFDFWESAGFALGGSALWEIAGERTPPSRNDMISTGIGGTFLGESLFRMAHLLLEKGGGMSPFWRETAAAVVSPSTAFNRHLQGRGPDSIFSSRGAEYYSRLQVGFMGTAENTQGNSGVNLKRGELQADFALDYGMPGKEGYVYSRPFDHFAFQATASSANGVENVMTRGLLAGRDYKAGSNYRGVWGLYGSYDYISPQIFRISSTALSLGTTGHWRGEDVVVQGTALAGLGYAAVGTVNSISAALDRDYHYGFAPQALVSARVIFRDRSSLDLTVRDYFVSDVAANARKGHDNIARADIAYTWRIKDQHAVTVKYLWNRRDARYPDIGDRSQRRGTFGIFYTLLGQERFGTVDWK
ncbi:DUF3943 domain-containing protein [Ramlibacter sp.]|uniref:DUF3943 domain-containing protein n=1 Tax=Ramlibacter sp. TaxID=1917967 RepID=UPI0018554F02|nr:DUF3943 domain-containing protein [Ramlibacter sp.]MBA2672933.1 DUF3943 domain-containing protein [Ramlibacter sp.]